MMIEFETGTAVSPETVGIREFARNITSVRRKLSRSPLVVLSNNHADFVAVSPKSYRAMVAAVEGLRWAALYNRTVRERRGNKKISWRETKRVLDIAR